MPNVNETSPSLTKAQKRALATGTHIAPVSIETTPAETPIGTVPETLETNSLGAIETTMDRTDSQGETEPVIGAEIPETLETEQIGLNDDTPPDSDVSDLGDEGLVDDATPAPSPVTAPVDDFTALIGNLLDKPDPAPVVAPVAVQPETTPEPEVNNLAAATQSPLPPTVEPNPFFAAVTQAIESEATALKIDGASKPNVEMMTLMGVMPIGLANSISLDVIPFYLQAERARFNMGDSNDRLTKIDTMIEDMQAKVGLLMQARQVIAPLVERNRAQIAAAERMINAAAMPITLASQPKNKTEGERKEPSEGMVDRALDVLRKCPAILKKDDYKAAKIAVTGRDCGDETAGGDLKRYTDAGILDRVGEKGSGTYRIADKYKRA